MTRSRLTTRWTSRRGQGSLLGLLIVIVIIMVAVWWLWLRPQGSPQQKPQFEGEAQTTLGRALQKGESVQDIENLRQLRMSIQMYREQNEQNPPALDPKWGVPLTCPVSDQPYSYDPQTGKVWDPTPGHQGF